MFDKNKDPFNKEKQGPEAAVSQFTQTGLSPHLSGFCAMAKKQNVLCYVVANSPQS